MKEESYVWCQEPILFSTPKERLKYKKTEDETSVRECVLYKTRNGTFLYVDFCGMKELTPEIRGSTIIETFTEEDKAIKFFEELCGN